MSFLLLLGQPGVGKCRLIESIVNNYENVVWITTTYTAEKIRKKLGDKIWVIDAFSWGPKIEIREKDYILTNPVNLNEISLAFSKVLDKIEGDYIVVLDSISGLATYNPLQKVANLLRVLITKIEIDKAKAIFTLVSGAQDKQYEIGTMIFFPNIVELFERSVRVLKSSKREIEKGEYEVERAKEILIKLLEN
jgi:KaiC/GvpD/RAD55 family RecA-like ATPase